MNKSEKSTRGRRILFIVLAIAMFALAAYRSTYTVDETQVAAVLQFGRTVGGVITDAGLHLKRPWQTVARADRRIRLLDLSPRERILAKGEPVVIHVFACWRVSSESFERYLAAGPAQDIDARLEEIIWPELDGEMLNRPLEALLTPGDDAAALSDVMVRVTARARKTAREQLGVDVVAVRVRRLTRPERVRERDYRDMASAYLEQSGAERADAQARAAEILGNARARIQRRLAETDVQARTMETDAQAQIDRMRAELNLDPTFRELLNTMEGWRRILEGQATLVLSPDSALARWLTGENLLEETSASPESAPDPEPAANQPESQPAPSTRPTTRPAPTTLPETAGTRPTTTSPATAP